ncbi:hypothetical protein ACTFIW_003882 [Dictyostelium discoideum]
MEFIEYLVNLDEQKKTIYEATFKKFTSLCIKLLTKKVKVDHTNPFYKSNFQLLVAYYVRNPFETVIAASGDIQDENTITATIEEQKSKCRNVLVAEKQLTLNREMFNFNKSIMDQTLESKKKKLDLLEKLSNYLIQTTQSIDKELDDVENSLKDY